MCYNGMQKIYIKFVLVLGGNYGIQNKNLPTILSLWT